MPRVVPSQVVGFIDQIFPWAQNSDQARQAQLAMQDSNRLSGLLALIKQIPPELIALPADEYSRFVCCVAAIEFQIAHWHTHGDSPLRHIPGLPETNPVALIRQALAACPDEVTPAAIADLQFITDAALRESIRSDVAAVNAALTNGEWKAGTVLAGSVVEALLLWALQQEPARNVSNAVNALVQRGEMGQPPAPLERWDLFTYILVAAELGKIEVATRTAALLAKDFRNLIHPGRAQRLGQKCDRATALSAVAAMEHVIRDLTP